MCFVETPPPCDPNAGNNSPAGSPTQPCKCKPISGIKVAAVTFISSHHLLKDEKAKWTNTGTLYVEPHFWEGRESHPVSHTMNTPIKLSVIVVVKPETYCIEKGTLIGKTAEGIEFKLENITFNQNAQTIEIASTTGFASKIQKLNCGIDWTATVPSGTHTSRTENETFVTFDTPIDEKILEDGVTYKRMAKAVELVGEANSLDPHAIVAHLMNKVPGYTLNPDASVPAEYIHPSYFNGYKDYTGRKNPDVGGAWGLADYFDKKAECQAICRFTRAVIHQIGLPGKGELVSIWAEPKDGGIKAQEGSWDAGASLKTKKDCRGKVWDAALVDSPVKAGEIWGSDKVGFNAFEACLKFTANGVTKYYGGGVDGAVFKSAQEVIKVFDALVWRSPAGVDISDPQNPIDYYKIEQVVRRYR